ncbi:pyrroloquinoline quinone biosynthesis protein PqqB [Limnobacter sp.]|uniref:pyrroloquinoline quinone biosynthesis protein PqqB n=1 Tax=Limnobacter sp. TaxID=2003368 RepID=UPI0035152AA8
MKIKVLGSAAGGGYPQWNCNCKNCQAVRNGTPGYTARTQSSIAISDGSPNWILVNASPDLLTQIKNTPELQPNRGPRDTGLAAVMLMDAQIDHSTGLLMMREGKTPMRLYTTPAVWEDLTNGLPLVPTLGFYCGVKWTPLCTECDEPFSIAPLESIKIKSIPLVSKAPPYSPSRYAQRRGDNIGLLIEDQNTGKKVFYAPGLEEITPDLLPHMLDADVLMVDGTFWTEDEMVAQGFSSKMAADMGHLPQSDKPGKPGSGMISQLKQFKHQRKVLIHINNTNPILNERGEERARLTQEGIEVSYDGMEILA